jgi:hypothetical protein
MLNILSENIVDVVMEMKYIINIYSKVLYRVGPNYKGLTKFIIVGQWVGFPGEEYNFNCTDVEFRTVSNEPTLYRVNVRM